VLRFIYDAVLAATDAAPDCVAIHHLSEDPDLATLDQPVSDRGKLTSRSLGENNMYHTSHTLEFYTPLLLIQVVIELSVTCLWNVLRVMGSLRLFT
jgi:hypothetical protein